MAAHGYERGTRDLDLASNVGLDTLTKLEHELRKTGLHTKLRLPDAGDDLGGVLDIATDVDEAGGLVDPVQVVDFANPHRPQRTPAADAIARSELVPGRAIRVAALGDLIALKLWARSLRDDADVVELLKRNPNANLTEIRETVDRYQLGERFDALVAGLRERR
ncbi:MAG TPA: hypothetical protein VH143_28620 [Kofleriaceae bacterium]|nr:hypothetical protein [Kofleriaceae bacterium]